MSLNPKGWLNYEKNGLETIKRSIERMLKSVQGPNFKLIDTLLKEHNETLAKVKRGLEMAQAEISKTLRKCGPDFDELKETQKELEELSGGLKKAEEAAKGFRRELGRNEKETCLRQSVERVSDLGRASSYGVSKVDF